MLPGQKNYADAELLAGYEAMNQQEAKILPPQHKDLLLREAMERLVQLYEATDKQDDVAKSRKTLEDQAGK